MVMESCSCELGRAGKRRRGEEEEEETISTTDRLSYLPEPILYHILSFLDTKSVVQTSVLSRVWRCVWKHVPVLHLHQCSFREASSFHKFVSDVLSRRYDLNVRKVSYVDDKGPWNERHKRMFVRVIKYALSHHVQHLVVHTGADGDCIEYSYQFSCLFGSVSNCNLKTLEFSDITLDHRFGSSGFLMLTTLNVANCLLDTDQGGNLNLCSNFPCLRDLVLSDCFLPDPKSEGSVKVYGPQLLSFRIDASDEFKIELFAPKLKHFGVCRDVGSQGFSKLTLPSLDHADIGLFKLWGEFEDDRGQVEQDLNSLFHGLCNAKSLKLNAYAIQVLNGISEFLEQQTPPFKRLENLIVESNGLAYQLTSYFFEGSSCKEPLILFDL